MKIGYARVSTDEQNLDLQMNALKEEGCGTVFTDKASGSAIAGRKGLKKALALCGPGDVLVVWKLDRLGRSLRDLVEMVHRLGEHSAGLRVLTGLGAAIDTTRPDGRMIFGIFATLAEFERELIRERTKAGMAAARLRGVRLGRPTKLDSTQVACAKNMIARKKHTPEDVAKYLGVHVNTLRRALRR
ncbi:MAG: recombinase family protein [Mesorhizobium sp.]